MFPSQVICKTFILVLINISADSESACEALLKSSPTNHDGSGVLQIILKTILDSDAQLADPMLSILSNMSRSETLVNKVFQAMLEIDDTILERLVATFTKIDFNKRKQHLNYLAAVFSNLSQTSSFRSLVAKIEHSPPIATFAFYQS